MASADQLPAARRARDQAERSRAAMEKIRSRTDATAKGLAAAGSAAVAGIGYTKLTDIFPTDGACWVWIAGLIGGLVLMIGAVIAGVRIFNGATRSVMTEPDPDETIRLNRLNACTRFSEDDEAKLRRVYKQMGELNGVKSLAAYQARARRFERIAARADSRDVADNLRERADVIMNEIVAAQERAGALILRNRASKALFGFRPLVCIALFAGGLLLAAASADAIEGERKGETELEKARLEVAKERTEVAKGRIGLVKEPIDALKGLAEGAKGVAEAQKAQIEVAELCAKAIEDPAIAAKLPPICR